MPETRYSAEQIDDYVELLGTNVALERSEIRSRLRQAASTERALGAFRAQQDRVIAEVEAARDRAQRNIGVAGLSDFAAEYEMVLTALKRQRAEFDRLFPSAGQQ